MKEKPELVTVIRCANDVYLLRSQVRGGRVKASALKKANPLSPVKSSFQVQRFMMANMVRTLRKSQRSWTVAMHWCVGRLCHYTGKNVLMIFQAIIILITVLELSEKVQGQ